MLISMVTFDRMTQNFFSLNVRLEWNQTPPRIGPRSLKYLKFKTCTSRRMDMFSLQKEVVHLEMTMCIEHRLGPRKFGNVVAYRTEQVEAWLLELVS